MNSNMEWLKFGEGGMVKNVKGYKSLQNTDALWEGEVTNPFDHEHRIQISLQIDAGKSKYLYIEYNAPTAKAMGIWIPKGDDEYGGDYFVSKLPDANSTTIICFDMTEFAPWQGTVSGLNIHFPGVSRNDIIKIYHIGVSEKAVETTDKRLYKTVADNRTGNMIRMAGFHETLISMDSEKGQTALLTYVPIVKGKSCGYELYMLSKILPFIEDNGRLIGSQDFKDLKTEDFPGGVKGSYKAGKVDVSCEMIPLLYGRDTKQQDGAAIFHIKTNPRAPVVLQCGGGSRFLTISGAIRPWFHDDFGKKDSIQIEGEQAVIENDKQPLVEGQPNTFAVKTSGRMSLGTQETGGRFLEIKMENGEGYVLFAFGPEAADSKKLLSTIDPKQAHPDLLNYYSNLMSSRVQTPEKVIDEAFSSAIYNLEYNYLKPYGWVECINHWDELYHQQHSAAAEWLGQTDRSKLCIQTAADFALPDGGIGIFTVNGIPHRAFGGSNHFWTRQVEHYFNHTGDLNFARAIAPAMDKVIAQTLAEYDAEGDLLLAWKAQIGNQEDMLEHPHNSTTPTIELIKMLRTRQMLAVAVGDNEKAELCSQMAAKSLSNLREQLWLPDLGRFAYYKDPQDVKRLDAQYQSFIYPVIDGIADPLDCWSGMRHLRDRLIGEGGEVYCSNNFSNHVNGTTWGSQAAVAQQPWGALGLSFTGFRNETYRPLKVAADWAMSPPKLGSWPEANDEGNAAYFSPPAALYIQAVIEAVFGLKMHKPQQSICVSPSFPDAWPNAKLDLPQYHVRYAREGNKLHYSLETDELLSRQVRWLLPVCEVEELKVNGKKQKYELELMSGLCGSFLIHLPKRLRISILLSGLCRAMRLIRALLPKAIRSKSISRTARS